MNELKRARIDLLRAQIAFAVNRGRDAPDLLLRAATQLEPLDGRAARETYLEALFAALFADRLAEAARTPGRGRASARPGRRRRHRRPWRTSCSTGSPRS